MKRISPKLAEYDVVVLNEAFVYRKALLRHCPHPYKQSLGRQWYSIFDSGVVILSKYPIVQWAVEHYRKRRGWDMFAAKGEGQRCMDWKTDGIFAYVCTIVFSWLLRPLNADQHGGAGKPGAF